MAVPVLSGSAAARYDEGRAHGGASGTDAGNDVQPDLTFFVELEPDPLVALFQDGRCFDSLERGGFGIAMAMLDLGDERARVARELEDRGIPVTAWLLLDRSDGYFLNADNDSLARARYLEFREWAARNDLALPRVGLDMEPPRPDVEILTRSPIGGFTALTLRRRGRARIVRAEESYTDLVHEIRADDRRVEAYLLPHLLDERKAGTTLLRRALGIVDVEVDREVFMLYSTYFGVAGVRGYMGEAQSIAVGCTGGGIDAGDPSFEERSLDWPGLERDLLAAAAHACPVYVFSLEGCVREGMLERIVEMDWSQPLPPVSASSALGAKLARQGLQRVLAAEPLLDRIRRIRRIARVAGRRLSS